MNYSWTQGTRLGSVTTQGSTYRYSYDENGLRYKKEKVVNDSVISTSRYYLDGATIIAEDRDGELIQYYYDSTGVVGMSYNGTNYYFAKDLFGNVHKIFHQDGTKVAEYEYDAWGNCEIKYNSISINDVSKSNIANVNPFRYRGYYYDVETGYYYCNSRYYSPELCRFISPDSIEYLEPESINGLNLYCYCMNNPISYADPSGHFAISTFLIGLAVTSLVSWGLSEIFGSQIVGGASSIANGAGAIKTGISLCYLGPWGIVAGVALIVVGGATIAFGANEIVDGVTGTNYIQDWTGMSDGWYAGLYTGLNIASSVGTIAGNMHLNQIRTNALNGLDDATYGPKAAKHIGDRSYYNSKLTQQEIIKGGQIRKAKYGVRGYEFRIKGYTVMGKSGNIHTGTWSLVYGDGTIWHFLLK